MPKAVYIKINDSGGDIGPYDLTLIDGSNNETPWSGNPVPKTSLIAGYQMIVPDAIVKVKVQSKTCTSFVLLTIPTTLCPCRKFDFTNGSYTFFECGRTVPTNLNVGASTGLRYCVDSSRPITKTGGVGTFTDSLECCSAGTPPSLTPTTTSTTSTTTTTTLNPLVSTTTSTTSTTTTTTQAVQATYNVSVYLNRQAPSPDPVSIVYSRDNGSTWTVWFAAANPADFSYNGFFGLSGSSGSSLLIALVKPSDGSNIRYGVGNVYITPIDDYTSLCGKATPFVISNLSNNTSVYLNVAISSNSLVAC